MGVAAMVLGILGLVTCWVPFVGLLLGLIAVVLGIVALIKKSGNKAFGVIGLVVGGVGAIVCAIVTTGFLFAANAGMDALDDYRAQHAEDPSQTVPFNP